MWKKGFIENAGPDNVKTFPFLLLGNKVDREDNRKVDARQAREWCEQNDGMSFFETSAKEGVSVETAFQEVAKKAIQRVGNEPIYMPSSIGGASGAIKLTSSNNAGGAGGSGRGNTQSKASCC